MPLACGRLQMEPNLNPSLEAQAIGRAHRLGQTQRVSVTHMLMEGSVEQQMRKLVQERARNNTLAAFESGVARVVGDGLGPGRVGGDAHMMH